MRTVSRIRLTIPSRNRSHCLHEGTSPLFLLNAHIIPSRTATLSTPATGTRHCGQGIGCLSAMSDGGAGKVSRGCRHTGAWKQAHRRVEASTHQPMCWHPRPALPLCHPCAPSVAKSLYLSHKARLRRWHKILISWISNRCQKRHTHSFGIRLKNLIIQPTFINLSRRSTFEIRAKKRIRVQT